MTCPHPHVVVTGAASGIGRATVLRLADAGWHVYAGVRRSGDGEALIRASKSGNITPLVMDVTEPDEISAGAETVDRHVGAAGLNALVDNAGIGVAVPMELVETEALRRQFEVNVFGQVAVTQEFLPLLRRTRGHLVVIGSIGDRFTPPFGGPLAASKAAIATMTDAFRQELALWGIRVVLMEPASIHTDAVDKLERDAIEAANEFSPDGRELYRESYLRMVGTALKRERKGSPPDVVADKILKVLNTSSAARPLSRRQGCCADGELGAVRANADPGRHAPQDLPPARPRLAVRDSGTSRSHPMRLANQDQVVALDPEFGRMAAEVGVHAWSLPQLTMREKALAADLCTANLGFPLLTHAQMAAANGVPVPEFFAAIRHLAPYVGYPTAAVALQQLQQLGTSGEADGAELGGRQELPRDVAGAPAGLDEDFAEFFTNQFNQRWNSGDLSPRERALACLAADVLNETLDESFALYADLAIAAGAGHEQINAVLRLVAEFGITKAWRAYRALATRSRSGAVPMRGHRR